MDHDMTRRKSMTSRASELRKEKEAIRKTYDFSALMWTKSTLSAGNGDCAELAQLPIGHVAIRDSTDKAGPVLLFDSREWKAFIGGVKGGEFDFFE